MSTTCSVPHDSEQNVRTVRSIKSYFTLMKSLNRDFVQVTLCAVVEVAIELPLLNFKSSSMAEMAAQCRISEVFAVE